jgi:hypothetical protein
MILGKGGMTVKTLLPCGLTLGLAIVLSCALNGRAEKSEAGSEAMISHDVFFTLKESTPEARKKLVEACKRYLSDHDGTVFFAAGARGEEFSRPVNDRDWDVGLHIVFKNKAAHDKYQDSPKHKQFIAENENTLKKVRVFDTKVEK